MDAILQEYATLAKMDGSADGLDEMLGYWDSFKKSMPAVMTAVQQGGTQAGIDEYNRKGKDNSVCAFAIGFLLQADKFHQRCFKHHGACL